MTDLSEMFKFAESNLLFELAGELIKLLFCEIWWLDILLSSLFISCLVSVLFFRISSLCSFKCFWNSLGKDMYLFNFIKKMSNK